MLQNLHRKSLRRSLWKVPSSLKLEQTMHNCFFHFDTNAIIARASKSRSDNDLKPIFQEIITLMHKKHHQISFTKMDNEASQCVQNELSNHNMHFQLVPPNNHRANAAERAIQTFKNHFISCLSTCDKNFPLHLWCRILPQVQLILNLLRNSNTMPHLSAECHLNGPFDYNKTLLAPFGSYCVIHESPAVRKSWDNHAQSGWYLGPAQNHHRCFNAYLPSTKSTRISDTAEFFHSACKMPPISNNDAIIEAAETLAKSLHNALSNSDNKLQEMHTNQNKHLQSLSDILSDASNASNQNPSLSNQLNQSHASLPRVSAPL